MSCLCLPAPPSSIWFEGLINNTTFCFFIYPSLSQRRCLVIFHWSSGLLHSRLKGTGTAGSFCF